MNNKWINLRRGRRWWLASVVILVTASLLAGCANPTGILSNPVGEGQESAQTQRQAGQGSSTTNLQAGAGESSQSPGQAEDGDKDQAVINSEGTTLPPQSPNEQKGLVQIGGSEGDGQPIHSGGVTWLTYTDQEYGFSLQYPDSYVILPEGTRGDNQQAAPLHVVRFQTKEIASGEMADVEPAQFAIEIYQRPASIGLRDWIQTSRFAPQNATFEAVELAGAQEGLKVTLQTLMAPNQFYYYATEKLIYRITPLGSYSAEMLTSFKLPLE